MNCPPAWESVRALILWRRDPAILFLSPSVLMGAQSHATDDVFGRSVVAPERCHPVPCH